MQDAINLDAVTILNSPDVRAWPATAEMQLIECSAKNTKFTFSKKDGVDRWPDQHYPYLKVGDTLQYTVWLFLNIGGRWFASGFIQMWFGRDGVGDQVSDYVNNWYYDAARWGPMVGHSIAVGEWIGFMVTAGDARNNGSSNIHERSNVVLIPAPLADVGSFPFDVRPTPAPAPRPDDPTPDDASALLAALERIADGCDGITAGVNALAAEVAALRGAAVKVPL